MKIRSLCALGKMRAYSADRQMVTLSPKAFSIPAGVDPLEHEPEAIHDFIQRNRWLHANCIVGLHNSHNQLLEPGEVVMSGTRSSLMAACCAGRRCVSSLYGSMASTAFLMMSALHAPSSSNALTRPATSSFPSIAGIRLTRNITR